MIRIRATLVSLLLLLSHHHELVVDAFSTGAGGCEGDMAAAGGLHLDTSNGRQVMDGTLADGDIRVTIGTQVLSETTATDVPIGQDLLITVDALDISYLGVLVRLEAPTGVDTAGALLPGSNTQNAGVCTAPVLGITHTDSSEKTMVTGTIRFDEEVLNVALDVSIVFVNNAQGSAYVYGRLNVNFRDTPVAPPVAAPVASPVAPIASPVAQPSVVPPIAPPVKAPVVRPAPVKAPVVRPAPVRVPVVRPTPVRVPVAVLPTAEPFTDDPLTFLPTATNRPSQGKVMGGMMMKNSKGKGNSKDKGGMMMMMMGGKGGGRMMMRGGMKMYKGDESTDDDVFVYHEKYAHVLHDFEYGNAHTVGETHNEELHIQVIDHEPYEP
jgi:hypothetical protein